VVRQLDAGENNHSEILEEIEKIEKIETVRGLQAVALD
jgi:hypothetical protein